MKRILFALAMVGCAFSLSPRAHAAAEVSINYFYDNLSPYGTWLDVADYGYCFQPNVAVNNSSWRPYSDGYWAYTDVGWTWVSYEDFGWATYHYGRWANLADYGWVWVPGYEWGPAWVSWRTGGDYIGWAPLPPSREYVYEGRPITGHVDVEFDIGPLYYNFVDIRYIGEPVLRERLVPPQQNINIVNRTVNVTNITYNNSTVYNYGPDLNRVNQFSTRPVQRLSIQRETNVTANVQGAKGNLNRVSGNQFVVVAPSIQKSAEKVAPKQVKAKVQQAKVEHGWQGVSNREQIQTAMKNENPKNVPAPSFQPKNGNANANSNANSAGGNSAQPNESNRAGENAAAPGQQAQQGDRGAQQAERNNRNENAGQNAEATQTESTNRQAQRRQRAEQQRSGREQTQPSANPDQDQPNAGRSEQTEQTYNRAARPPHGKRNQSQSQPSQSPDRNDQEASRPDRQGARANQSVRDQQSQNDQPQNDQSQHARPQRPEASQPQNERADQNRSDANNAEQGQRPPRDRSQQQAQRTSPRERAPQARPNRQQSQPQGQDDQNGERKGKKKNKTEEAQPTP